jgi:DMSO/TMAO reductase YedYZ molybdopterin-dependent catalytic subunit
MLALKKWNKNLEFSEGGPLRLVFEGHDCYESVKSIDRIIVCSNMIEGTAQRIAMERLEKNEKKAPQATIRESF